MYKYKSINETLAMYPVPRSFQVGFDELKVVAEGLIRPECVLALSNGRLIAANGDGGYSVIETDGRVTHVTNPVSEGRKYLPNGITLTEAGQVIFADLGAAEGGLFCIDRAGKVEPVVTHIDGTPLPPSNFVIFDKGGRMWFTISTRRAPRTLAWNHDVADGFIAVKDTSGVRIVADGIGYTNEIAFSPDGRWLYANETYNQRTSRYPLIDGTTLGPKEVVASYGGADFPDGLAFDAHGGAWITCIGSNRLLLLRPEGEIQTVLQDTDLAYADMLAGMIRNKTLSQSDMSSAGHSRLGNISSLAFGGAQLKTAYLGCLLGKGVRAFESPVQGLEPVHWRYDLKS